MCVKDHLEPLVEFFFLPGEESSWSLAGETLPFLKNGALGGVPLGFLGLMALAGAWGVLRA